MKRNIRYYQVITFAGAIIMLLIVVGLILATYALPQLSSIVPLFSLAMEYHFLLMIVAVIIAIVFGFVWARMLTNELNDQSVQTESLTEIVMKFLSSEERLILTHLAQKGGICRQQEFAYLNSMGRVKAMRTVQKLSQKGIISVEPHGKQRTIKLLVDIGVKRAQ